MRNSTQSPSSESPVAIDLFSGAGGLSEGLLASGINVAVAVEGHPHPALTHAFNHPDTSVICSNITDLSIDFVKKELEKQTGRKSPDIIVGGPPCQGFSSAGRQKLDDPRNRLCNEFIRYIKEFDPAMFVFENVPGLTKFANQSAIHGLLDEFWSLGYRIHGLDNDSDYYPDEYPIVDSSAYGVPQHRKRLVLIGQKIDRIENKFEWPKPTHGESGELIPYVSTKDAIDDLSFLSGGFECHAYQNPCNSSYQASRRENSLALFNHLATQHKIETTKMFRKIGSGKTIRSVEEKLRSGKQRMRRFQPDAASLAILALPDDYIHYRLHRIPTVREMARLQSFDDDYVFFGKRTTSELKRRVDVPQYTQVGNAVPPLLAKAIGISTMHCFGSNAKDLRNLKTRRERQELVLGSSGYDGYSLKEIALSEVNLTDGAGKLLNLPLTELSPAYRQVSRKRWKQTRRKRQLSSARRLSLK